MTILKVSHFETIQAEQYNLEKKNCLPVNVRSAVNRSDVEWI
jgi:hypothetical protein